MTKNVTSFAPPLANLNREAGNLTETDGAGPSVPRPTSVSAFGATSLDRRPDCAKGATPSVPIDEVPESPMDCEPTEREQTWRENLLSSNSILDRDFSRPSRREGSPIARFADRRSPEGTSQDTDFAENVLVVEVDEGATEASVRGRGDVLGSGEDSHADSAANTRRPRANAASEKPRSKECKEPKLRRSKLSKFEPFEEGVYGVSQRCQRCQHGFKGAQFHCYVMLSDPSQCLKCHHDAQKCSFRTTGYQSTGDALNADLLATIGLGPSPPASRHTTPHERTSPPLDLHEVASVAPPKRLHSARDDVPEDGPSQRTRSHALDRRTSHIRTSDLPLPVRSAVRSTLRSATTTEVSDSDTDAVVSRRLRRERRFRERTTGLGSALALISTIDSRDHERALLNQLELMREDNDLSLRRLVSQRRVMDASIDALKAQLHI